MSQYGHFQGLNGEFFAYMGPGPGARGPEAQRPGAHICYNLPSRTCRPCSPSSSQPSADTWLGKLWHTWARGPGPRASESLGPGPGRPGPESGPRPWGRGPRGRPGAPGPRAYVCEYFPLAPSRTVLPLAAACRRCLLWRHCRCLLWLAAAAFCHYLTGHKICRVRSLSHNGYRRTSIIIIISAGPERTF